MDMATPIIILAGQSNASGLSSEIRTSLDAMHGTGNYILVEVAANGAPLTRTRDGEDWAASDELRAELAHALNAALDAEGAGRIEGVVWIQGEGDTYGFGNPDSYADAFRGMILGVSKAVAELRGGDDGGLASAPVVMPQLSDHAPAAPGRTNWTTIQQEQAAISLDERGVSTLDTDALAAVTGIAPADMFRDGLHYSAAFSPLLADALVAGLFRDGTALNSAGSERPYRFFLVDGEQSAPVEAADGYLDHVIASVSFSLRHHSQQLDTLTLTGTADLDATGNGLDNIILGNSGDNLINGAWGNDTLRGGAGDDIFHDSRGADLMVGGSGNDVYYLDDPGDRIEEQVAQGTDQVNASVSTTLGTHVEYLRLVGGGNLDGTGNGADNRLFGNSGDNRLDGQGGSDSIEGGGGNDRLRGGSGYDTLDGGDGNDTLFGGSFADTVLGGAGDDQLAGNAGFDRLEGGAGNDHLDGGIHPDELLGDSGDDFLFGGHGDDALSGGSGDDRALGGAHRDMISGGDGADSLYGNAGLDTLEGGAGADYLDGGIHADWLLGGGHDDTLWAGGGDDRLDGGGGNDLLMGGLGADTYIFSPGHGNDTVTGFEAGNPLERLDLSALEVFDSVEEVLAAATEDHLGVMIETEDGSSILLEGVAMGDLEFADFIF